MALITEQASNTAARTAAQKAVAAAQRAGASREAYTRKNYTQAANGNWVEKSNSSSTPSYSSNNYSSGNNSGYSEDYSGGGSSGGSSGGNSYDALAAALAAMRQARLEAINAANVALDQQGKASEQSYNSNLSTINNDYDKLVNQSEVNRYKARIGQREALANRGALDSGAGRQENLIMSNNYDNALNDIQTNRNSEIAKVKNAISQMWANINTQKASNMASGLSDYNSALNTLINSTYSGYSPANSDYYNAAQSALANGANYLNNASLSNNQGAVTAALSGNSGDAYSALLKAMLANRS